MSDHPADHPHTDPGDGRTKCERCGKYVWPVIHSCKGVPVTGPARLRGAAARLPQQTSDPGVWDDLAAEYANLTPARTRANRSLLGEWLEPCCDLHNVHCEPPSELCCRQCAEATHPEHPRGVRCVLAAAAERGRQGTQR